MVNTGHPIIGTDILGQNAYANIIASPRGAGDGENKEYVKIWAWCSTNDAIISLDGGDTDNVYVPAGKEPIIVDKVKITQAIQAKNATGGSNYANLVVLAQPEG